MSNAGTVLVGDCWLEAFEPGNRACSQKCGLIVEAWGSAQSQLAYPIGKGSANPQQIRPVRLPKVKSALCTSAIFHAHFAEGFGYKLLQQKHGTPAMPCEESTVWIVQDFVECDLFSNGSVMSKGWASMPILNAILCIPVPARDSQCHQYLNIQKVPPNCRRKLLRELLVAKCPSERCAAHLWSPYRCCLYQWHKIS